MVSDGQEVLLNSEEAGDEPFMLASNLPGAVVLAHKDRVNAGRYAIKKFGVNVIILDDGFQYLSLKGQLNLLLVDQTNPFGNRSLLPRGILRGTDSPSLQGFLCLPYKIRNRAGS